MNKKSVLLILLGVALLFSCSFVEDDPPYFPQTDYKQEMRSFVQKISSYSKSINSNFVVIPQNGQELVTKNGAEDGEPDMNYLNSIDGLGREGLLFGYDQDNIATSENDTYLRAPKAEYKVLFAEWITNKNNAEELLDGFKPLILKLMELKI